MINEILIGLIILAAIIFALGIRIIRPTHRGVVEFLGKYQNAREPGFNWIIPILQRLYTVNTTEQMTNIEPQEIITKDNLNATVDCVIYFKVKRHPTEVYDSCEQKAHQFISGMNANHFI